MIETFKKILKYEGIPLKEFSRRIGIGYGSLRTLISGEKIPRWIKAFNFGYFLGSKSKNTEPDECPKCGMESYLVGLMGCRDENCPEVEKFDVNATVINPKTLKDEKL